MVDVFLIRRRAIELALKHDYSERSVSSKLTYDKNGLKKLFVVSLVKLVSLLVHTRKLLINCNNL